MNQPRNDASKSPTQPFLREPVPLSPIKSGPSHPIYPAAHDTLATAVQTVVDYLWDDEREAYEALVPKRRRRHIFRSLLVLRRWLDEQREAARSALDNSLQPTIGKGGRHE